MMRFEYNSDYPLEERIKIVAKEIRDDYPSISEEHAKLIAAMVRPLEDKVTNDDIFERYYFMMFLLPKNHPAFNSIYREILDIYHDGLNYNLYNKAMEEIIKYANNERNKFPLLNEFY